MLLLYCLHTENIGGIGSTGQSGQNKTFNIFKNQTSWTYFSYWTYCPRSSMDRVTDFESGGCAFDPRRGTSTYDETPDIWRKTYPLIIDTSWTDLCRFLLGTPSQRGKRRIIKNIRNDGKWIWKFQLGHIDHKGVRNFEWGCQGKSAMKRTGSKEWSVNSWDYSGACSSSL